MGVNTPHDTKLASIKNIPSGLAKEFCALFSKRDRYLCKPFGPDEEWRTWHKLEDHQIVEVLVIQLRVLFAFDAYKKHKKVWKKAKKGEKGEKSEKGAERG